MEVYLIYIFIFDLALGGAGRLLNVGPFSIRMIIFISLIIFYIIRSLKYKKIKKHVNYLFLFLLLIIFTISLLIGVNNSGLGQAFNKYFSYSFIFILPFFIEIFNNSRKSIKYFELFCKLVYFQAILISLIYILLLLFNYEAYRWLNPVLTSNQLGMLDIINGSIPRVFMKNGIFIPFVLNYEIIKHIVNYERMSLKKTIKFIILFLGLFASMTMAFWGGFVVIFIISLILYRKEFFSCKKILTLILLTIILIFASYELNIFGILEQRFSTQDSSIQIKGSQMMALLETFNQKPILGHGFGKEIYVEVGSFSRFSSDWEIMWLEMLVNIGIFGTLIFLIFIFYNIFYMYKVSKIINKKEKIILISIISSIFGLFFINFSNPFLNNPIGLGYLVFSIGIFNGFLNGSNSITYMVESSKVSRTKTD